MSEIGWVVYVAGGVLMFLSYVLGYAVGMGKGEQKVLRAFHMKRSGRDDD